MCDLDQGQQVLASRQGIGLSVVDSSHLVDCCQPILVLLDSITLRSITNTFSEPNFDLIYLVFRCCYSLRTSNYCSPIINQQDYQHNCFLPVQLPEVLTLSADRGLFWEILRLWTNFVKKNGDGLIGHQTRVNFEIHAQFCFEST